MKNVIFLLSLLFVTNSAFADDSDGRCSPIRKCEGQRWIRNNRGYFDKVELELSKPMAIGRKLCAPSGEGDTVYGPGVTFSNGVQFLFGAKTITLGSSPDSLRTVSLIEGTFVSGLQSPPLSPNSMYTSIDSTIFGTSLIFEDDRYDIKCTTEQ